MLTKIRNLPLRAAVAVQSAGVTSSAKGEGTLANMRTRRGRTELTVGALMGYMTVGASKAFAAADTGNTRESASGILDLINTFTTFLIIILAAGSLLMGIFAALQFVGSAGNEKVTRNARNTIKNVIIGLVVAAGIFILKTAVIELVAAPGAEEGDNSTGDQFREELNNPGLE